MITKGIEQLVAEAEAEIETLSAEDAIALMDDEDVELVDIRDIRELWREGAVPGARHVPRGMVEFWIDPESPYHKPFFASGKKFVFFCAGGMRSALATQAAQNMGLGPGRPHRRRLRRLEGGGRADRGEAASLTRISHHGRGLRPAQGVRQDLKFLAGFAGIRRDKWGVARSCTSLALEFDPALALHGPTLALEPRRGHRTMVPRAERGGRGSVLPVLHAGQSRPDHDQTCGLNPRRRPSALGRALRTAPRRL